jgi:hypothetical protein
MIDYFALAAALARRQAQFVIDGEETDAWERTIERQDVPEGEEWESEEESEG